MDQTQSYSQESYHGAIHYESEAQRLQREADNFTKKYEHEKKLLLILEEKLKQSINELADKKNALKQVRPPTAQSKKDAALIKTKENRLDHALVKYNDVQAQNKRYRKEIDVMRKEQKNQFRVNKGLGGEIRVAGDSAKKLNVTTYQGQRISEETNNQILALKAKHEAEKYNFERKIKDLQEKLKERDDTDLERTKTKNVEQTKQQTNSQAVFSNPADLLKFRLAKWTQNNKEKKNLMDTYIRNIKIIEDAFDQIKEQTGISSIQEIVTTYIKAEEQNQSLFNFVGLMNSDIDVIEGQNKDIEQEIKRLEEFGEMTAQEKLEAKRKLQLEIEENKNLMSDKELQIKSTEDQMAQIKNYVWNIVEEFKQSQFFLSVAQNMQYDDDLQFNENNVTLYLSELEEYISLFITYLAYKQENPDAAISSLSLDRMAQKDFERGPINIDPPNPNDALANEDLETEDDVITNPAALYKKYEEQALKEQTGISSNQRK